MGKILEAIGLIIGIIFVVGFFFFAYVYPIINNNNPNNFVKIDSVISENTIDETQLKTDMKTQSFDYVLYGKSGKITATLYGGVKNYLQSKEPTTYIGYESDTYKMVLDNKIQDKYLNEIFDNIKTQTNIKDDQAKIAVSLVQNIRYPSLSYQNTQQSYPYDTLYNKFGICSEKSLLLAYLLKNLEYEVVLFSFNKENHMAVGVKTDDKYSYKNTGYAFIETTEPSIITDSSGDYVGAGKLNSFPTIIPISSGNTLNSLSEEYIDAIKYNQLKSQGEILSPEKYRQWEVLMWKYGITTNDGKSVGENPSNNPLCEGNLFCDGKCWEGCGPHEIWKCTSNGGICEADPNNCPVGQYSCNGKCWLGCNSGEVWSCTAQGGVCNY
jgi:hypothetical protein